MQSVLLFPIVWLLTAFTLYSCFIVLACTPPGFWLAMRLMALYENTIIYVYFSIVTILSVIISMLPDSQFPQYESCEILTHPPD